MFFSFLLWRRCVEKTFEVIMMICMLMIMVLLVGADTSGKNHNEHEHKALCGLLKVAVRDWEIVRKRAPSDPLRKALKRTIFGEHDYSEVESLKLPLLKDYEKVKSGFSARYRWCGERLSEKELPENRPPRWSGHSAPHDMVCLCTVGKGGWPLNKNEGSTLDRGNLCGHDKKALGAETNEGWGSTQDGLGKDQIEATWNKVVTPCLQLGNAQAGNLRDALQRFKEKINNKTEGNSENKYRLGDGDFDNYACSGNKNVCVMYYNGTSVTQKKHAKPWWIELEAAINNQAYAEKELKKSEEKPKNEGQNQHHTQKHEKTQPQQAPRTAALKSAPQHSKETEQDNTENISSPLATLEEASDTLIIPPCLWLLSALLFI
ncbi:Variant surface glycoprotein [Trypanosoma congolense IL3000]|uniref:Variant surface glycoprotein n=1 Tax=Trypanosoma congolense (strain IL3000) TaxID=1068625 RepID=F9WJ51_TRYCI|nr:Variant surface glycoprotein [Trypanosoma congolense IL3000]